MAIRCVSGRPGAGKSLYLTSKVIAKAIASDRPIYVYGMEGLTLPHEPLGEEILQEVGKQGYTLPKVEELEKIPGGAVIIIDECANFFGAGTGKIIPDPLKKWFRMHRHRTDGRGNPQDIWVGCQDASQLTAQFKVLIDEYYHLKRGSFLGLKGMSFMTVWTNGAPGDKGAVSMGTRMLFDDKKFYGCYKSVDDGVGEQTEAQRFAGGKWGAMAAVLFLAFIFVSFYQMITGGLDEVEEEKVRQAVVQPTFENNEVRWPKHEIQKGRITITIRPDEIPEHGRYPIWK